MRRTLPPLVVAAVLTVTLSPVPPATADTRGDVHSVLRWNVAATDTLVAAGPAVPGSAGTLYLSYVQRAVYDAVQHAGPSASLPAAVAASAHTVLTHYFSAQEAALDAEYDRALAAIPASGVRARGVAAGEAAAARLLEDRAHDGLNGPALPLPGPVVAGVWTPAVTDPPITVAAGSWLPRVRPFVLGSPSQLRPAGPPALTSARYAQDYEEVRTLGSEKSTNQVQRSVALFWSDPPGVQSQRALRSYSLEKDLDAVETARLLALADTASADALIACADAKFFFNFWRPFSAVPGGDDDGNAATVGDAGWKPLVKPTPNFPEYPSNHSCSTTAMVTVLDGLDGNSPFSYTLTSVVTGATHTFTSADEVSAHVGNGRVWGGLHFRFAVEDGTDIGRAVGAMVLRSDR